MGARVVVALCWSLAQFCKWSSLDSGVLKKTRCQEALGGSVPERKLGVRVWRRQFPGVTQELLLLIVVSCWSERRPSHSFSSDDIV